MFDYMIADMESNKILTPIVIKLLLRAKKKKFHLSLYLNLISNCL